MRDSSDMSGQRLRWWQEDPPQTQQKWYREPALETETFPAPSQVVVQPLTFEEELEAEASRRAELQRDAVVIEGNFVSARRKMGRTFAWIVGPVVLMNLMIAVLVHSWQNAIIPLIFLAEYFLIVAITRQQFRRQKPRLVLSSLGLTMDLPHYRLGPIFWDEIQSVRVVNIGFMTHLVVTLKDPKKTFDRALELMPGPMAWFTRLFMVKRNIEVTDQWFAESSKEIAAQIAAFHPSSVAEKK